jgi:hypothetical protein
MRFVPPLEEARAGENGVSFLRKYGFLLISPLLLLGFNKVRFFLFWGGKVIYGRG